MLAQMPVAELHPVPDAHVPIMKFKFSGVSIDLLYVKVGLLVVPEVIHLVCPRPPFRDLDITHNSILENVDEETARCLNGCRVTDLILGLVPNIQPQLGTKQQLLKELLYNLEMHKVLG